jgi:glycosyltransferase involved in cell wall biosynthesis
LLRQYRVLDRASVVDHVPLVEILYKAVIGLISGDRRRGFRRNITAVNSQFMKDFVREVYGIEAHVVYPAFLQREAVGGLPWEERQLRFVALGRIAPDKGCMTLIDLFAQLSRRFPAAKFMMIGRSADPSYEQRLRDYARAQGVTLALESHAEHTEVRQTLARSMFFLHAKEYEHFGIAILEAIAAGCLTFVHDSGGQTEIVRPAVLRYREPADLVRGVEMLLHDAKLREATAGELRVIAEEFLGRDFGKELERVLLPLWDQTWKGKQRKL